VASRLVRPRATSQNEANSGDHAGCSNWEKESKKGWTSNVPKPSSRKKKEEKTENKKTNPYPEERIA